MSAPETVLPPPKPEVKQKPPLPSKPMNGTPDTPPTDVGTSARNSGKVLEMVSKFNQPDVQSPPGGTADSIVSAKKAKRGPTVKPRQKVASKPAIKAEQAPPLPVKRRQSQQKETELAGKKETTAVKVVGESCVPDGGRSASGGKEVELQSGGPRLEQKPKPLPEPQCEKNCGCVCHLQRPGMKLVWVPISEKEENSDEVVTQDQETEIKKDEDNDERGGEGESETEVQEEDDEEGDDMYRSDSSEEEDSDNGVPQQGNKEKFKAMLNIIEGQLRRKSDPVPEVVLTAVRALPTASSMTEDEEESIYETTIDLLPPPKQTSDKSLPVPKIQVNKPSQASKEEGVEDPPAIPPRMPINRSRTPRISQGVPLPQPPGRPLSPKRTSSDHASYDSPQPARPAPPPPPAKANGRRFSSQSFKDDDEGSTAEDCEKEARRPSVGLVRQKSLDMEAHMPEDFLYQIYTETYITKEIRRQTVCRNISKTSADFQMDNGHPRTPTVSSSGAGALRSSPVPTLKQNTLWQDLPAVQESGILQTLTPEQCKYQESMFEVLTSEVSYLRSLRVLTEHFLESRELNDTVTIRDKKTLFSNILRIREVSEKFLKDLERRLDESLILTNICDIINYHAQHNFPAYIDYVRNQIYQEKTFSKLMQTNTQFATVIGRLQESPKCQRLPFISFLLLPFQRITRIKILIENILKRIEVQAPEEEVTTKALESVTKIIEECNTQVGKMKQMEELIEINNILEFDKLKAVPIISQNRFLEKRGELQEMAKGATIFLKPKFTPVYLFLFNDLLVIANKKGSERYVVVDHAHRSLVQVQTMGEEMPGLENCFCLVLLENHQGRVTERLLKAPSQPDMHRWLAAFPMPDEQNRDNNEVIYEDWDCPQVQCVEQYIAKQADELNLEPPEIINVICKSTEGWYQGIRLSDGQKGWFPVANVLEITNEHVRRRNLREHYRVMQASSTRSNKSLS